MLDQRGGRAASPSWFGDNFWLKLVRANFEGEVWDDNKEFF